MNQRTNIAVTFSNVSTTLGGVRILEDVSASVPAGSSTAIVGPNGAGKTTLLLTLLGQIPYSGAIRVACGSDGCVPRIGYVPQRLPVDRGLPITVNEFLVMGAQRRPLWLGLSKEGRERSRSVLASVRAESLADRAIGALSGGEFQRILLALALQQEPELLILDEPAAGVDVQGELVFCELLENLRRERGFTQLMVSHDLATVTHHASHVICLNRRVVAEGPPREALTPDHLQAVFGIHMGLVSARSMPAEQKSCSASCCSEKHHA